MKYHHLCFALIGWWLLGCATQQVQQPQVETLKQKKVAYGYEVGHPESTISEMKELALALKEARRTGNWANPQFAKLGFVEDRKYAESPTERAPNFNAFTCYTAGMTEKPPYKDQVACWTDIYYYRNDYQDPDGVARSHPTGYWLFAFYDGRVVKAGPGEVRLWKGHPVCPGMKEYSTSLPKFDNFTERGQEVTLSESSS